MAALLKSLGRLLWRALLLAGWVSLVLVLGVAALDFSGAPQRWVRELLQARLGSLGGTVSVERVRIDWLAPGLVLHGFSVEDDDELLRADLLRLSFGVGRHGLHLSQVAIDGGHVRLGPALTNGVRGLLDLHPDAGGGLELRESMPLPSIQVRGLAVSVELLERGSPLPLGTLDLALYSRSPSEGTVKGRLLLPLAEGGGAPAAVHIEGRRTSKDDLELFARAVGLELERLAIPRLDFLDALRAADPRGRVSLDASGRLSITGRAPTEGEVRLALEQGGFRPPGSPRVLEDIALDLRAVWRPEDAGVLWDPDAWNGHASFSGSWGERALRGGLRVGRAAADGRLLEGWARVPDLPLTSELIQLAGDPRWMRQIWESLDPFGAADVTFGLHVDESWTPDLPIDPHTEYVAGIEVAPGSGGTWLGWPLPNEPRLAFPMPATCERGRAWFAHVGRSPRPDYLAVDFEGRHASGPVSVRYYSWSPPRDMPVFAPGYGRPEADLVVNVPELAIGEQLRAALQGLEGIREAQTVFEEYAPRGGRLAAELMLHSRAALPHVAARLHARLLGTAGAWREVPVPVEGVRGTLEYREDGSGRRGLRFELDARTESCEQATLRGRMRTDLAADGAAGERLGCIEVGAEGLDLAGSERAVIASALPGVGAALEQFAPEGAANVALTWCKAAADAPRDTLVEVVPTGPVRLRPAAFPLRFEGARGRVLVSASVPPGASAEGAGAATVETRVLPIVAGVAAPLVATMTGSFPADGPGHVTVHAAGLRPSDADLMRDVGAALASATAEERDLPLHSPELHGAIDVHVDVELPPEADARVDYELILLGNDVVTEQGFRVDDIHGRLRLEGKELRGGGLTARMASTSVHLDDVRLSGGPEGAVLRTLISIDDMPLDRPHLSSFLDEATLDALIDELGWRGTVDVHRCLLDVSPTADGGQRVSLSGDVTLSDVHLELGLPVTVRSSAAHIERLLLEGGGVRAWGELDDLYGQIAGRELGPMSALVTYYDSRLSFDEVRGTFERGWVSGLGQSHEEAGPSLRTGPPFSVDLVAPFPFQLALRLERLDVSRLLRDLFPSRIGNKGDLDCELRVSGDLQDLLSIRGNGRGELRRTRLWSIPVFRDLFSQLGFDATAVFDRMSTRYFIENGVIYMEDISVRSPLLRLVGRGTLGMDGRLQHDLEVNYALVDKFAPFRRLFYLLQNTLLYVSIRGDMERPKVILRGGLTELLQRSPRAYRALPMPRFTPLPERF